MVITDVVLSLEKTRELKPNVGLQFTVSGLIVPSPSNSHATTEHMNMSFLLL